MLRWGRRRLALPITVAVVATGAAAALADPGDNDPTFSAGDATLGYDARDFGAGSAYSDVAAGPNGTLVVVGRELKNTPLDDDSTVVARYTALGTADPTFAPAATVPGLMTLAAPAGRGERVAVDSQARILVVSQSQDAARNIVVTRLTPTGGLDTSFGGGDGTVIYDPPGSGAVPVVYGLAVGPGDSVTFGVAVDDTPFLSPIVRLTAAGDLDPSFGGGDGVYTPGFAAGDVVGLDLALDAAGRAVWATWNGVTPSTTAVKRLNEAGSLVARTYDLPADIKQPDLRLEAIGTDVLMASTKASDPGRSMRITRLREDGSVAPGFSATPPTITIGRAATTKLTGIATLSDGRIAVAGQATWNEIGTPPATGANTQQFLARFSATGVPDATFHPAGPDPFASLQGLGQPATTNVTGLGGPVVVAQDELVTVGQFATSTSTGDQAYIARFGVEGSAPVADLQVAYPGIGTPPRQVGLARPGQTVTFDGRGSTDAEGPIAKYEWDVDGLPGFEQQGPVVTHAYPTPNPRTVTLRVTDSDGLVSTKGAVVQVYPNQQPTATLTTGENTLDPNTTAGPSSRTGTSTVRVVGRRRHGVRSVALDIDGAPGFERRPRGRDRRVPGLLRGRDLPGALPRHRRGGPFAHVRGDDHDPRAAVRGQSRTGIRRLRAYAPCWKKDVKENGRTVWTASDPPPPPPYELVAQSIGAARAPPPRRCSSSLRGARRRRWSTACTSPSTTCCRSSRRLARRRSSRTPGRPSRRSVGVPPV